MTGRRGVAAALIATLLLGGGCATTPPPAGWLSGRLLVKVEAAGDQPARSVSSAFELRGDDREGELRLNSPLGLRVATATWAPGLARLVTGDGEARYADLDALARDALGEALPLRALPDWLRGRPWPGADSRPAGAGFDQLGWHVALDRFEAGWVEASRATPPAVVVRARLERPA